MDEDTGQVPHTVEFTDCSEGDPSLWHWNFGDGSTSNSENPRHTYYEAGTYTVTLTVSNTLGTGTTGTDTGISDKISLIHVYPAPVAYFTTDISSGLAPLTVQFIDISSGIPVYWSWDFGDGITSHFQNPKHTYYEPGTYKVSLAVENAFGANFPKGSSIINVYSLPVADFSSNVSSGQTPLAVQFTDKSTGNPTTWFWDFGDGTSSNHKNPIHEYIADGTYKVTLTVSNAVGTSTSESCLIDVNSNNMAAEFESSETTGTAPFTVEFYDSSTGSPTAWQWDFNSDGQVDAIEQNPVYEFTNAGVYSVSLRVSNGNALGNITKTDYITVGGGSSGTITGSSSGSSSGGSHSSGKASVTSAASSPEPPSNVEAKASDQNFVLSKNHVKFEFTKGNTPIDVVEFDAKKSLGKITTTVEQLKGRSPLTPTEPGGKVIKYLNIWVGNSGTANPENIGNATVEFRISKDKVTTNEESTVVLQRYADGNWNSLDTTKMREDAQYVYYKAKTPGFSPFAITKKSESELNNSLVNSRPSTEVTPIEEMNNFKQPGLNKSMGSQVESENTGLSGSTIIIVAIVLIIISLIGLIVKEKGKYK